MLVIIVIFCDFLNKKNSHLLFNLISSVCSVQEFKLFNFAKNFLVLVILRIKLYEKLISDEELCS
jgi:hypothetical protein